MPPDGAEARANVVATLTRIAHERFVSDEVGELLAELDGVADETDAALVRLTRHEWDRARRVPSDLAAEMAHAAGVAGAGPGKSQGATPLPSLLAPPPRPPPRQRPPPP